MVSINKYNQVEFGNSPYLDKVKLFSTDLNRLMISLIEVKSQHIQIWEIQPKVELIKSYDCNIYKHQYLSDYAFIGNDSLIISFLPSSVKDNHNVAFLKVYKEKIIYTVDFKGLPITSSSNPELKRLHSVYSMPYYFPLLVHERVAYTSFVPFLTDSMNWIGSSNPSFIYGINFSNSGILSKGLKSTIITDSIVNTLRSVPESFSLVNGGFIKNDKLYYGYAYDYRIFGEDLKGLDKMMIIGNPLPVENVISASKKAGINHKAFDSQDLFKYGKFALNKDSSSIIRLNRLPIEKGNIFESNYPLHLLQIFPFSENYSVNYIALIPSGYTDHVLIPLVSGVILYNLKESKSRGKIVLDLFKYKEEQQHHSFQKSLTDLRSIPSDRNNLSLNEYLKKCSGLKSLAGKTVILINEEKACISCVKDLDSYLQNDWLCNNDKIQISFISKNDSSETHLKGKCSIFKTQLEEIEQVLMPWTNILRLYFDENEEIINRELYSANNLDELKLFISTNSK